MPKLKNWAFVDRVLSKLSTVYVAQNLEESIVSIKESLEKPYTVCVFGNIFDDPRHDPETTAFSDGHRIITSYCNTIDLEKGQVVTGSGTVYELIGDSNKLQTLA